MSDRPGDEDFFKFHLAYKQVINMEVLAGRYGSPVTPLLQLRMPKATPSNATMARRTRMPGSCADWKRGILRIPAQPDLRRRPGILVSAEGWSRRRGLPQDFAVRFLPDAPRLHRGGNIAMWCEVKRLNGFKGDVTSRPKACRRASPPPTDCRGRRMPADGSR